MLFLVDNFAKTGTIKVKNCMSDFHAKIKLEGYLKRHYPNFERLQVNRCNEDGLNDLFKNFSDIFGNFKN